MMNHKTATVSIVIPVYNEAAHLHACLQAIGRQTIVPHEVLVVDNNSTDRTRAIAESFPFVRLITEPRQGVVHARTKGFNSARGDIIGRIDADTILPSDWIERLLSIMKNDTIDAVSGAVYYYDIPTPRLSGVFDLFFRQYLANKLREEMFLYGANMAIRRKAWKQSRSHLCTSAGIHEDFDLAIHLQEQGFNVVFDKSLLAAVSLRRFDGSIRQFWNYAMLSPTTYRLHGRHRQKYMYVVIAVVVSTYWFIALNHRLFDTQTGRVSLRRLYAATSPGRVNPATFVD